MKTKLLFLPLVATLAFAGCSNDEPAAVTPHGSESGYLAVNIVTPAETTKAAEDFEDGIGNENAATEGVFLFFDANGFATQLPQKVALTWTDQTNPNEVAIEKISEAVLVLTGSEHNKPTQMLAVLNAPADIDFAHKSLSEVRDIIGSYAATYDAAGKLQPLVITNSAYKDGETEVCATAIKGPFASETDAKKAENVVDVYVERVVAKVTTAVTGGDTFTKDETITIDGKEVTLKPVIEGIEIANIAEKSYLFKSIEGNAGWSWTGWNDAANRRSYWAACPADMTYANQSWTAIGATDALTAQTFYVQENTTATKSCVLVTATIQAKDESGKYAPCTFLRWGGRYYSKDNFKNQYATLLESKGFRITTAEGNRTINPEDLAWLTASTADATGTHAQLVAEGKIKSYETTVQLTDAAAALTFTLNGAASTAAAVNEFLLEEPQRVWLWEGGRAYYFVNIKHFGTGDFAEGVVRNHVYKLDLNSVSGVGVPVFDPEEEIIPEKPSDDLFYIAARINILKWRIVSQTVDFK